MMRLPALLGLILAAFAAPPAHADGPVLVELFASKNCRSCPAAYRAMDELEAQRDDVLVLTWPVDYWDYLGSKEKMALPESKDRQRGYVERFELRGPYTPQAVFNGAEQAPGNKASKVGAALGRTMSLSASGISLSGKNGKVSLKGETDSLTDLWWVAYLKDEDNETKMPNPVTSARQIGPWLGGRADIELPACESGCMLIVQEAGFGPVLAVMDVR
jgi:hypothetical protein